MSQIYRQGDVLIVATTKKPSQQAKRITDKGRTILAYGEVTGHAHEVIAATAIDRDPVPSQQLFEEPDGSRLLVLRRDTELRHEEHRTIPLPAGTYEVIRQREYVAADLSRSVAD